jgi:hypothetical protein
MIDTTGQATMSGGLMLFPDAGTDGSWYFVPQRPRISMETGKPLFQFLKYRRPPSADRSEAGGGLVTLEVDLGLPAETAERALTALRGERGRADLTLQPVKPDRVSCAFSLAPDDPGQGTTVSADPPHRAVGQLSLSMEMATLFEAGMNAGTAPGRVTYRFTLTTRRPAVAATLTIDWKRAAQLFAELAGTGPILFSQLESGVSQLTERRGIEVRVRADDPVDAAKAMGLAMREAAVLVAGRLFDPVPGAAPGATTNDVTPERVLLDGQSYLLRAGAQEGTASYDLSQPRVGELTLAIADTLANMLAAVPAAAQPQVVLISDR